MQEEKQQPQKTKPQQQIVRRMVKPRVSNDSRNLSQRTLGYGRLKEWASFENPGQLVLFMSSQKHQIKEFLGQDTIDQDLFRLLVQSITLAIKANHQQESVKNVLEVLCQTKFLNEFSVKCLNELQERKFLEEAKNFVMSMIDIMSSVLVHLPEQAFKVVVAVALAENTLRQGGFSEELSQILLSVQELNKMAKHVHGENEKYAPKRGSGKYVRKRVDETPPDNFRYLPVLPTPYDLQENCNPFIRAVCIDTSYQDIDHYLDIQYRLMRQDFLIPLRQGINMLRANKGNKHLKSTDLNLWLYRDVTIEGTIFQSGYNHVLLIPKLTSSDWRRGKRFMLGSLLCLSDDNFQTIVFATVSLRDETMMDDGKIGVKIQSGLDIIFNNKMSAVYEVAEAVTFFEPYLQVLMGLQEISKLPLQDYIIECNKDLKPPQYLLHSRSVPCYDLKCMMGDQESDTSVPVLTTVKWPPASSMLLNQSQRDAAMLALTKEMALIQGPPGTGKTYVGLKVMETFLTNRKTISPGDKRAPILVVCYTNHALDQFLEGVLKFCKSGIVRVGGSSRSDVLKPFHYIALRSASRKNKDNNSISVRTSRYESYQEMKEIGKKLNDLDGAMDAMELQIQDEVMFKGFMREAHFQSLQRDAHLIKGREAMRAWLNAPVGAPEDVLLRSTEVNLSKLVLKWPFVSEDDARITDMGILERASVYQLYVRWVREEIDNRIAVALNDGRHPEMDNLVEKYKEMESRSHQEILPDEHVITFLPKQILTNIQCILDEASLPVGSKIKFWTLGLSGSLESQMKEIETLKNAIEDVEKGIYDFYRQSDLKEDELSSIDSDASDDVDTKDDDDDDVSSAAGRRPDIVTRKSFLPTLHKAVQLDLDRDAEDDEGFVTVTRRKPLSLQKLLRLLNKEPMTEEEEDKVEDVWSLNVDRRFALYNLWASRYKRKLTDEMEFEVERYNTVFKKCQEIDREEMIAILGKANVIGMTTTGPLNTGPYSGPWAARSSWWRRRPRCWSLTS